MAQDTSQDRFDIACLRHIATDADARQASLAAAMIKLHALTIARNAPAQRDEALEIIRYSQKLYAAVPTKGSLAKVLEGHPVSARLGRGAQADLVDAIWDFLRCGEPEVG